MGGLSRQAAGKLLDRTMLAMLNDEPVDIRAWGNELGMAGFLEKREYMNLAVDVEDAAWADFELEMSAFDAEKERLRTDALEAVGRNEGLIAKLQEAGSTTESYVESWLQLVEGQARSMSRLGISMADSLKKWDLRTSLDGDGPDYATMGVDGYEAAVKQELNDQEDWLNHI